MLTFTAFTVNVKQEAYQQEHPANPCCGLADAL